jgi:hypothetical protein
MDKNSFVEKYINQINESNFKLVFDKIESEKNPFNSTTDLSEYLSDKIYREFDSCKKDIYQIWKNENFVKARIKNIANSYKFKKVHLENYLLNLVGKKMCDLLEKNKIENIIDDFVNNIENDYSEIGFKSIKSDFIKVLKNSLLFNFQRGFPVNIENINSGVMTANAGDSHQFLFLARAILAGFNCSNVDVRSSRYDAIIDYNNKLYRIQVKGITSSESSIQFRDRDRGGQGIDHTHERNIGKKITSKDCDVYVAVDKNTGVCYLIPMKWVDEKNIDKLRISEISMFKESWDIFKTLT